MKMKLLSWLLIILCAQVLSSLAHHNSLPDKGLTVSIHAANGTVALYGDRNDIEHAFKHGMGNPSKAQRGKGAYGGANIVRGPPSKSSGVPFLKKKPSFFVPALISCLSFGSLLNLF